MVYFIIRDDIFTIEAYQMGINKVQLKDSVNQPNIPNPFTNKQYSQMNQIMSMNISPKNDLILCTFVIKATSQRFDAQLKKVLPIKQSTARQQLLNRVMAKLMTNYLNNLTPQDMYIISKLNFIVNQTRFYKITQSNRQRFRDQFQDRMRVLLENDKNGEHVQTFRLILYDMLKFRKKLQLLKLIIDYLSIHDLKTNQVLIDFFQQFNYTNYTGYYDVQVFALLQRYLSFQHNNMTNTQEWVKPIILQVAVRNCHHLQIQTHPQFNKILQGIIIQISEKRVNIKQKYSYLRQLTNWAQYQSPYLINTVEAEVGIKLAYQIIKQIEAQLTQKKQLKIQGLNNQIQQIIGNIKYFASVSHKILNKNENQLIDQLNILASKTIEYGYFKNLEQLALQQIVTLMNIDINYSQVLQAKMIQKIVIFLKNQQGQNGIIKRIRLYQYLTRLSVIKKINVATQLQPLLLNEEKRLKNFRLFQILRLYNVFRILNIKSTVIQDYFDYQLKNNELVVIQNMSRTVLKNFSFDIIQQATNSLIKKYTTQKSKDLNILEILWFASKGSNLKVQQNYNPVFFYWFDKNIQLFKKLTQDQKNVHITMKKAINQLGVSSIYKLKTLHSPIAYEVLLQILTSHFSYQQLKSDSQKSSQYYKLKQILQSQLLNLIIKHNNRHSFFIKVMSSLLILNRNKQFINTYYKKFRSIKQVIQLMKRQECIFASEMISLRSLMISSFLKQIQFQQEVKAKQINNIVQVWLWINFHLHNYRYKNVIWPSFNSTNIERHGQKILKHLDSFHNDLLSLQWKISNCSQHQTELSQIKQIIQKTELQPIYQGKVAKISLSFQLIQKLLILPNTLKFLCYRNPQYAEQYIQQIMKKYQPKMSFKVAILYNFAYSIKQLLKLDVRRKFKRWIINTLITQYPAQHNPSSLIYYLKLNIQIPNYKIVQDYVIGQLKNLNFYILPILFSNDYFSSMKYENKERQYLNFIQHSSNNHWTFSIIRQFPLQYFYIASAYLGLCFQFANRAQVLKAVINKIFKIEGSQQLIIKSIKKWPLSPKINQQPFYLFYMLIKLSILNIDNSTNEYKLTQQILTSIQSADSQIQANVLKLLQNDSRQYLHKFYPNNVQYVKHKQIDETKKDIGFPMYKGKQVFVHNHQPGYMRVVDQYLKKCITIENISMLDIQDIDNQIQEVWKSMQLSKKTQTQSQKEISKDIRI